jgi:tetratricopeptide (TPR) repeat protein
VVYLAWRARDLDDAPLAGKLLHLALDDITSPGERLVTHLAAVAYLRKGDRPWEALPLVDELLADPKFARFPELWRLGSALAEGAGKKERAIACLEKALDLEYQDLPQVIDLEPLREDYRKLLAHYDTLVDSARLCKAEPMRDLPARVIRAADRWRALDRDSTDPSELAGGILRKLGSVELAWDYLTTRHAADSSWGALGRELTAKNDHTLAERALAAASEQTPRDLAIMWDRAQNLKQLGKDSEAKRVLQKMVETKPDHVSQEWLRGRARWELEGR